MAARQPAGSRALVIACDTVVEVDGRILEKPGPSASAGADMLRALSGREHAVHTGVVIVSPRAGAVALLSEWSESTRVRFAPLSEAVIGAYVASGEGADKAGGYGARPGAAIASASSARN